MLVVVSTPVSFVVGFLSAFRCAGPEDGGCVCFGDQKDGDEGHAADYYDDPVGPSPAHILEDEAADYRSNDGAIVCVSMVYVFSWQFDHSYPFIGPILQIEKASALCSSSEISLTVPGAFEIIAAAQKAPMNLNTKIVAIFCASAQGRTKITNSPSAIMYTGRRPYISLKGANTTLPQAIPSK